MATTPYKRRYVPSNPRADSSGNVYEHVLIAERALGRPLPKGAQIHHVDGKQWNNAQSNLVICDSNGYHALLHVRARVLRAGGDPNTQHICSRCKTVKGRPAFHRNPERQSGLQNVCIACKRAQDAGRWRVGKTASRGINS